MAWDVDDKKAIKQIKKLDRAKQEDISDIVALLTTQLKLGGSSGLSGWPNFGSLTRITGYKLKAGERAYHCHLIKGNPTYVAVWIEKKGTRKNVSKQQKNSQGEIRLIFVGTHEKAPY